MKLSLILPAILAAGSLAAAAEAPLWMRYPAISPDGKTIAFTYKGDIFTVPASGGPARQLTTHRSFDTRPLWSPDGQTIVFASDRAGNMDIYSVSVAGGEPRRLTTNTAAETPIAFLNPSTILFSSAIEPDGSAILFPSSQFPQVYSLDITRPGARPQLYSTLPMEDISVSPDGQSLLYHDKKGYEDPLRKHHTSSITRDIWEATGATLPARERKFTKLTTFKGEDRNPVWRPDGKSFVYLSEQDGTFNIYRRNLDGSGETRLTDYKLHPVRNLTSSADGNTLAYFWNGEIYTLTPGSQPTKLNVTITTDRADYDSTMMVNRSGARSIALNGKGKEIAFINHGDVYVTSADYSTTRRITNTSEQERNVDFAPDGRSLIYSAERDGRWGIYRASLVNPGDKHFTYAYEIKEEPLILLEQNAFQPKFSPDGKEIAFLRDRTELCVYNIASKEIRTVLPGSFNYSYSDGDQAFSWSPDSRWLLAQFFEKGGWNNIDIALVKADGSGEYTNLTRSGYSDGNPKWVLGGKAMTWTSDRAGFRSHGSWGSENDVYIMFFDGDAWDQWRLSKEERELADEAKKKDSDKDADKDSKDKKKDKKGSKKDDDSKEVKPLTFDLRHRDNRIARLTPNSSSLSDFILSDDGRKLYYTASFEGGSDLWVHDLDDRSTKILFKGAGWGEFVPDEKVENIYMASGSGIKKLDLKSKDTKHIDYAADFTYRPAKEREYIFNHAWRQVKDKFYDPDIHGIDWEGYRDAYARFLPHINNNYDFQELLSEMLGELNGSHTGARFYGNMAATSTPATAWLGAIWDNAWQGDGLRVSEVVEMGPMDKASLAIKPGMIVTAIDGQPILAGRDYYPMLSGKSGKKVMLTILDPVTGKKTDKQITASSSGQRSQLLYNRWVERNRAFVDSISGGKVGYIHIEGMDSPSFRKTFSELLGRYRNADAVVIDTRHNGGGWLHEDLAMLLSGKVFATHEPRGQFVSNDPFWQWTKPSCVLMCEDNYSNAHGFPFTYKALGIGKLIGAPVPGTMTAVWWENQIDPTIVFGIPQVGMKDRNGQWLENQELQPDIEIYNTPEQQISGDDAQLRAAVEEMLRASRAK
ncbi:MAG: S41 family peptidase [Alloprevotella sp.]|nr:S41 family peptidase [Alloprevotella sp.]